MKGFNFTIDYVLYELSYSNMILLGATLPSYDSSKKTNTKTSNEEIIDASDPRNKERIRNLFNSIG